MRLELLSFYLHVASKFIAIYGLKIYVTIMAEKSLSAWSSRELLVVQSVYGFDLSNKQLSSDISSIYFIKPYF